MFGTISTPIGPTVCCQNRAEPFQYTMTPEQEAVLRSIRKLVDFWRITPDELESGFRAVVQPKREPKAPPTLKYRHPISSETWNGEGPQPTWLREALTKEGYTVDELRVQPTAPEKAPT